MVQMANIFKAAGVWVGAIFLLYGNQEVSSQTALIYTGAREALAPTRSPVPGTFRNTISQLLPALRCLANPVPEPSLSREKLSRSESTYFV